MYMVIRRGVFQMSFPCKSLSGSLVLIRSVFRLYIRPSLSSLLICTALFFCHLRQNLCPPLCRFSFNLQMESSIGSEQYSSTIFFSSKYSVPNGQWQSSRFESAASVNLLSYVWWFVYENKEVPNYLHICMALPIMCQA